jgi:hypothetical protein
VPEQRPCQQLRGFPNIRFQDVVDHRLVDDHPKGIGKITDAGGEYQDCGQQWLDQRLECHEGQEAVKQEHQNHTQHENKLPVCGVAQIKPCCQRVPKQLIVEQDDKKGGQQG